MRQDWRGRAAALLAALALGACGATGAPGGRSVVTGVGDDDMLKLRAGPGTGFRVIAGLPDGARVINHGCARVGGTPWCEVSPSEAPALRGHVSGHYLRDP